VNESIEIARLHSRLIETGGQGRQDTGRRIIRCCQRLRDIKRTGAFIVDEDVGERSSDVNAGSVSARLASRVIWTNHSSVPPWCGHATGIVGPPGDAAQRQGLAAESGQ
jgi:hypothetical protein